MNIETLIRAIPKTETHLHIEGALSWDLLRENCPEKYDEPPASWASDFKFRDFSHFEDELLGYAADFFTSAERYHINAKRVFEGHVAANVKYVEVSFASGCMEFFQLDAHEVLDSILDAVPEGLEVRVFFGIHHEGYTPKMEPVIHSLIEGDKLAGIDLHGHEGAPMGDWAPSVYEKARANGKYTKAHAGEFMGPAFIRYAIDELKVERIEHGVRAVEDPALPALLRDKGIALDVCPISNVKLDVTKSFSGHQIRTLIDQGVTCTLSTDDPVVFGNNIIDEYLSLNRDESISRTELLSIAKNGFAVSLLSDEQKQYWVNQIDSIIRND